MKVHDYRSVGPYEWMDAEDGRCSKCGLWRPVKRMGHRMLCRGCATDAGLYQEAMA